MTRFFFITGEEETRLSGQKLKHIVQTPYTLYFQY